MLPELGNMSLKFGTIQMLFEHPIVPFVQSNAVIVDHSSGIDLTLEVPVSLVPV